MNPYLLPTIEFGPRVMARLFAQIDPAQWDVALDPNRFTPREVAAHMADWEPILLERMQAAYDQPGTTVAVYDEGRMAEEHGYSHTEPREQLDLFARRRAETAAWLRRLTNDAWTRAIDHPERGIMTIYDQAHLLLGHDLYHLEQLSAYLKK